MTFSFSQGFESGTNGAQPTASQLGVTYIVIANSAGTGGSAVTYSAAAARSGSMGLSMALASTPTYLRLDTTAFTTRRAVIRRPYKHTAVPTAVSELVRILNTAQAQMASVYVSTSGTVFPTAKSTFLNAQASPALTVGHDYWIDLAVTAESASGAGDGVVEMRVTDRADGSTVASTSATGQTVGNTLPGQFRWGGATTGGGWTTDTLDDIAAGEVASGWITAAPLAVSLALSPNSGTMPYTTTATVTCTGGTGVNRTYAVDWGDGTTSAAQSSPTFTKQVTGSASFTGRTATVTVTETAAS